MSPSWLLPWISSPRPPLPTSSCPGNQLASKLKFSQNLHHRSTQKARLKRRHLQKAEPIILLLGNAITIHYHPTFQNVWPNLMIFIIAMIKIINALSLRLCMELVLLFNFPTFGNEIDCTDKLIYLAHISQYVRNILSNGSALVQTILPR